MHPQTARRFPRGVDLGRGPIRTSRAAPQSLLQRDQKPFESRKHPSLGGDHQDGRDRLIVQEGQRIALERVFSNRMMTSLIVDHPYRCVPDPLCEAQAYDFRSHRVSLVAQDEQISQARQPIRIDRVDKFKLALRRRLAAGRLAGRSLEVLTVTRRKPADNEGESSVQSMESASRRRRYRRCRPAERSDLFGSRAARRPRK